MKVHVHSLSLLLLLLGALCAQAQQPAKTQQTTIAIDTLFYCDGTFLACNHSTNSYLSVSDPFQVDTSLTVWEFFDVCPPSGIPIHCDTGGSVFYQFTQQGTHAVRVLCYCYNDSLQFEKIYCYNNSIEHTTLPLASADTVCPHSLVTIVDATPWADSLEDLERRWMVENGPTINTLPTTADSIDLTIDEPTIIVLQYLRSEIIYDLYKDSIGLAYCPYSGQVTIHTAPMVNDHDTLVFCVDTTLLWHGQSLTASGFFVDTHTTRYGCDSSYYLSLTIHPDFVQYDTLVQCSDSAIVYHGQTFVQSGNYTISYPIASGCDSSYHLLFEQHKHYSFHDTVNSCDGSDYRYHERIYTVPGTYMLPYTTHAGCDSIYHLQLNDYTLMGRWEFSNDHEHWVNDSIPFESCEPFHLYMRHHSVGATQTQWLLGDGSSSNLTSVLHSYSAGLYSISLLLSNEGGCADTLLFPNAVQVFANPEVQFDWDPAWANYSMPEITLINQSTPLDSNAHFLWTIEHPDGYDTFSDWYPRYRWTPANEVREQSFSIALAEHYYNPTLSGDTVVCSDSSYRTITLRNDYLYFPNVVTPNGDGINDTWRIVGLLEFGCYPDNHLYIYNRWGRLLYERHYIDSEDDFWIPPTDIPDGTYYFRFDGKGDCGHAVHNGVIEILRR